MSRLWEKGEPLHPEVLAFTVGDDPRWDRLLARHDCLTNLAWVDVLAAAGLLEADEVTRLIDALRSLYRQACEDMLVVAAEDEDIHTTVERLLTEKLGDLGKKVHAARSRNDQVATDVRLWTLENLAELGQVVGELAASLVRLARRHENVPMPGHTHLRPAMPSSVAFFATSHADLLCDDLTHFRDVYRAVDHSPLGTGAGFGVALQVDRWRAARLLGFHRLQRNALAVQTSRGKLEARALGAACSLTNDLARLAWDLALYTAPEYGFFRLPASCATGSSIMPQKRNPDLMEVTRARAAQVRGLLSMVLDVSGSLPSGYHRDLQVTKAALMQGLDHARATAKVMTICINDLEVDEERCRKAMSSEMASASEALKLAQQGTPFRDAYREVGEALREGRTAGWQVDPRQQVSLGGPGNLDLEGLSTELQDATAWFEKQERHLSSSWMALADPPQKSEGSE